jgi:hypothetical protein
MRTVEESRWNVARRFASLLQGDIFRRGVPVFVGFVDEDLGIGALVEEVREPTPTWGDSYIIVEWSSDLRQLLPGIIPKIEHPNRPVCATRSEDVFTPRNEGNVKNFLVMRNQMCLCM